MRSALKTQRPNQRTVQWRAIFLGVFFLLFLLIGAAPASAQTCWNGNSGMANGTGACIDAHGVQQQVNNNSGANLCVPIGHAAEWQSFRSAPPAGVGIGSCAAACWIPQLGAWVPHGWWTTRYGISYANNCAGMCTTCNSNYSIVSCNNGTVEGWWGFWDYCIDDCTWGQACF